MQNIVDKLAHKICTCLGLNQKILREKTSANKRRVLNYYLPIALWLHQQVVLGKKDDDGGGSAVCVGLTMPQGAGKTTLAECLKVALAVLEYRVAVVSLDDFYYSHEEQQKLALRNPQNRYLQGRGVAGTHDLELASTTLDNLINGKNERLRIPSFNKALYDGKGDLEEKEKWPWVQGPLDLVIIEGWMLGYMGLKAHNPKIEHLDVGMQQVNEHLKRYYSLYLKLDAAIVVGIEDSSIVYNWREDQEELLRRQGSGAMTEKEVKTFCDRFMPSYETYMGDLYQNGIEPYVAKDRHLQFKLGANREPYLQEQLQSILAEHGGLKRFDPSFLASTPLINRKKSVTISVSSAGFNGGNSAKISIDGVPVAVDKNETGHYRGLHIVLINPSNGVAEFAQVFDTYKGCGELDYFIQEAEAHAELGGSRAEYIVVAACQDEFTTALSNEAKQWFQDIGSTGIYKLGYRQPWAFIGCVSGRYSRNSHFIKSEKVGKSEKEVVSLTQIYMVQEDLKPLLEKPTEEMDIDEPGQSIFEGCSSGQAIGATKTDYVVPRVFGMGQSY